MANPPTNSGVVDCAGDQATAAVQDYAAAAAQSATAAAANANGDYAVTAWLACKVAGI